MIPLPLQLARCVSLSKVAELAEAPVSSASSLTRFACAQKRVCVSVYVSSLAFHSGRNAGSSRSPAHLEILALTAMYFSFLIHEMEIIIPICVPRKFIERINWCLYRVLKPYANIKVIVNRPLGIRELSNQRSNSWTIFMFYSNLGFRACAR